MLEHKINKTSSYTQAPMFTFISNYPCGIGDVYVLALVSV